MAPETPVTPDSGLTAQVLLAIGEMKTQLAVMDTKLSQVPDHEVRLRKLEQFRWTLTGAVLLGSGGAGLLGALLEHLIIHG